MKQKRKSKISHWNAGDVILAIPKIEFILESSSNKVKYRSLSQSFYVSPQSPTRSSTRPVSNYDPKDFLFKPRGTASPSINAKKPLKLPEKRNLSAVLIDQNTQIDQINLTNFSKRPKPRQKYEIPVIKLEKNLPNSKTFENSQKASQKLRKTIKTAATVAPDKRSISKKYTRRIRSNMKDESVGNEFLASQSSGIFSQTSLLNKYLSVYQADLNNY